MALIDNIIAFWEMEESTGTRFDSAGTNHLALGTSPGSVTGKVGTAANFLSASSHYLMCADNAALSVPTTSFTACCWINFTSKVANTGIIGKYNEFAEWAIDYRGTEDRFRFFICGATSFGDLTTIFANNFGAPTTGLWYFIVVWYDRDTDVVGIHVNDGTANTAARTTDSYDSTEPFVIGAAQFYGIYFDGAIDQVGFWKRALTAPERTWLYNAGAGRSYAEIVAYESAPSVSLMGVILM